MMRPIEADAALDDADVNPAAVYDWLSSLLAREVPAGALSACAEGEVAVLLEALATAPGMAKLTQTLRALSADAERTARDLAGAYAFLFLGVGAGRGAPPYESSWRNPDRLTCRAEEASMRALLRELDMHVAADFPESADHVAVQLAAMAELSRRAGRDARAAGQAAALAVQMTEWLPLFAKACRLGDRSGFYAQVAEAAATFVAADAQARARTRPERRRQSIPERTGGKP